MSPQEAARLTGHELGENTGSMHPAIYVTAFHDGDSNELKVVGHSPSMPSRGFVSVELGDGTVINMRLCDARALARALNSAVDYAIPPLRTAGVEP